MMLNFSAAALTRPLLLVSALMLSACANQAPAELVDRAGSYHGKKTRLASLSYRPSAKEAAIPTAAAAPVPAISSRDVDVEQMKPLPPESRAADKTETHLANALHHDTPGFIWPLQGRLISSFGHKGKGISEEGITLAVAPATPIRASASGTVLYAGNKLKPYGHMVILRHENGVTTTYAHAAELRVRQGQRVRQGELIALAGSSGNALTPQLFYAMREQDTPIDPLTRLPATTQTFASAEP
ncbi:MAG: M23 family metallopeptidase [Alphaproteobacteria bacterium]|nr:M23 family metallopeptidase [Alphaproteobacteria bacterium]